MPVSVTAFIATTTTSTIIMGGNYWPSVLLFLAGGLIGLYCNCRRRKQRREMEEFREREVRRRQLQEQLQHQQFMLNFPALVGVERLRQERLAHLLVSGVSSFFVYMVHACILLRRERMMNERRSGVNGMVSLCSVQMPSHPFLILFLLSTAGIANVPRRIYGRLWRRQPTFRDHIMCDLSRRLYPRRAHPVFQKLPARLSCRMHHGLAGQTSGMPVLSNSLW
jgi:hypothetical protein